MSKELPQPEDTFGFTEKERLYERISHERFMAIVADERTAVHHIEVSTNSYGEFLFITMSQAAGQERKFVTMWGAGFHEFRERWLTNEWPLYNTQEFPQMITQKIAPQHAP